MDSSQSTVKCKFCEKRFSKWSNCKHHIKYVHKLHLNGDPITDLTRKIFSCANCEKKFTSNQNLKKHIAATHSTDPKKHRCPQCEYETVSLGNFKRHMNSFLHYEPTNDGQDISGSETIPNEYFKCSKCSSKFQNKKYLEQHKNKSHKMIELKRECPICHEILVGRNKSYFYHHLKSKHNIEMKLEKYGFESVEEFTLWKNEIEKETGASFVATKVLEDRTYYTCHRSGHYTPIHDRKRRLKRSGSCKINAFCPATMTMQKKNEKIQVRFISTHVGHKGEMENRRSTRRKKQYEEEKDTAHQIANEKPPEEILRTVNEDDILLQTPGKPDESIANFEQLKLEAVKEMDALARDIDTSEKAKYVLDEINKIRMALEAMSSSQLSVIFQDQNATINVTKTGG